MACHRRRARQASSPARVPELWLSAYRDAHLSFTAIEREARRARRVAQHGRRRRPPPQESLAVGDFAGEESFLRQTTDAFLGMQEAQ